MEEDVMLTTYDNSYNPFTDFNRWYKEDIRLGHDTCGVLAREADVSPVFSDTLNDRETRRAMDWIVGNYPMIWKIVKPSDY